MPGAIEQPIRIAVIIPTFNRPDHMITAIKSVMAQTYPHWLLIISDDCSTVDYSGIEPWLEDARIHYIKRAVNGGCNAARNTAIDAAIQLGADYIASMDDEEQLDPHCLEKAIEAIRQNPGIGWFVSNTTGDAKSATRQIVRDGVYDWIDDYMYGKALRGDKMHVISVGTLGDIRFDGRYRASNMWPFYLRLASKTKIYGYIYPSKHIQYLDAGITKTTARHPRTWRELYSRFAKHAYAIRIRPAKLQAYKYFLLELAKSPKRVILLLLKSSRRHAAKQSL